MTKIPSLSEAQYVIHDEEEDEDGYKSVKNKYSGQKHHEKAISTIVSLHYQANSKLLAGFMEAVEKVLIK